MPENKSLRAFIEGLVACDDPPDEERLSELRQQLGRNVSRMKKQGHRSILILLAGIAILLIGLAFVLIAANFDQQIVWLMRTGFGLVIAGAVTVILASIGLVLFRGFGYVWARHDFQDAALMELSLQVQRLSQQLDAMRQKP